MGIKGGGVLRSGDTFWKFIIKIKIVLHERISVTDLYHYMIFILGCIIGIFYEPWWYSSL
jgi:hypothetical protein